MSPGTRDRLRAGPGPKYSEAVLGTFWYLWLALLGVLLLRNVFPARFLGMVQRLGRLGPDGFNYRLVHLALWDHERTQNVLLGPRPEPLDPPVARALLASLGALEAVTETEGPGPALRNYRRAAARLQLANQALDAGDVEGALAGLESAEPFVRQSLPAFQDRLWNVGICILIAAGRYREALDSPQTADRSPEAVLHRAFGEVNRAEALHNLGRDEEALALLDRALVPLEPVTPYLDPEPVSLVVAGAALLRAWILAVGGDPGSARAHLESMESDIVSRDYAPELLFTRALVELRAGKLDLAAPLARRGLEVSKRASSRRNGQFLLALVLLTRHTPGDPDEAAAHVEAGLDARYQGQGAWALCELARSHRARGEADEADRLLALARARDPEAAFHRS